MADPTIMNPGVLIYRCRLCGRLDETFRVPRLSRAMVAIGATGFYAIPDGGMARLTGVHACGDGSYGGTDFVGGRPDAEVKEA